MFSLQDVSKDEKIEDDKEISPDPEDNFDNLFNRKFSTTSSIYAETTMSYPDSRQQLLSIASLIQNKIRENALDCSAQSKAGFPEFDIPVISSEIRSTTGYKLCDENDRELYNLIVNNLVPSLIEIFQFLEHVFRIYSPSCNIISIVYINRIYVMHGLSFTNSNWKALWVSVVILSQKIWDDSSIKTCEFVKLLPSMNRKLLRELELRVLHLLRYKVTVKPSIYAKYYFGLRKNFTDISGITDCNWVFRPLSVRNAKRIEAIDASRYISIVKKRDKSSKGVDYSSCPNSAKSLDSNYSLSFKDDIEFEAKEGKELPIRGMNTYEDITRRVDLSRFVIS